ncbi:MAG: hypothetical protein HF314_15340 [Ignavibacteria bacterium]|jgi:hypothetical protein|nr:hypothetical protein [Ignavibacteria bacterium]MCU7504454.1 hypothetical protein [Ignavibacteria bacterium]MCU7517455.1 hypothetical protein [Ignavibacteria bacterium]
MNHESRRPRGVTVIIYVNIIEAIITLVFWILVLKRLFASGYLPEGMDRSSAASTFGFMVADLLWALPILVLSIPGLLKMRFRGWTFAQLANILWLYSLTSGWMRDMYLGNVAPGNVLFLPFALFSLWAVYYLWKQRGRFMP